MSVISTPTSALTHTLSHTVTLTLSLTHTHTYTHTHTHTLTHSHTQVTERIAHTGQTDQSSTNPQVIITYTVETKQAKLCEHYDSRTIHKIINNYRLSIIVHVFVSVFVYRYFITVCLDWQ